MDILTGEIIEREPLKVEIRGSYKIHSDPVHMRLKWHEDNSAHTAEVEMIESSGGIFVLKVLKEASEENSEHPYTIGISSYLEIAEVINNLSELRHRVDNINKRFHNNITNHVKKIMLEENLTNQYILKFLMQIDSKLDELLDTVKPDEHIEGLKREHILSISGGGFYFYTENSVKIGTSLYVQSMPKEGSGLNFAAICKVKEIIDTGEGSICETSFDYIDEVSRENIIHYVFKKDREKLKRSKS